MVRGDATGEAYAQGRMDALETWVEFYELGRETAKQIYK